MVVIDSSNPLHHSLTSMPVKTLITIEATVHAPADTTWNMWTQPEHITQWSTPSDDWHTTRATMDVREGGKFLSRMEAKDGSAGFDFSGTFTKVVPRQELEYTLDDGRKVSVTFDEHDGHTHITESFEAESENPIEMQRQGWQAILDTFKKYTEEHAQA